MNTPDFSGLSTRTLESELLKIDAAIQAVETAKSSIRQIGGTVIIEDVEGALDDLHGLLDDAMGDTINTWRVEVNGELMCRDGEIEVRHERIELQNKMGA